MTAKGRELYFTYPDGRDQKKLGFEIPNKGQLVVLSTPEEIQQAKDLGYVPMELIVHSPSFAIGETKTVFGMAVEDDEIIPFPNKEVTNRVAEMVNTRI
jgi:hypothetical protein